MPELPEVEVLCRYLAPRLVGRTIRTVVVHRAKAVRPWTPTGFARWVRGAEVRSVSRRAKFLRFELVHGSTATPRLLLGHLGMTGRMYVRPAAGWVGAHVSVVLGLGDEDWVFEDVRQFGGFGREADRLEALGPEPLDDDFDVARLARCLGGSRQAIKTRLMDQAVLAGVGNIYASEALHVAGIAPDRETRGLDGAEVAQLWAALREVLNEAIRLGSSLPLDFTGDGAGDGLFYYGRASEDQESSAERFRVYDRAGQPCYGCGGAIERLVQAGRSTFCCRRCQR